MKYPPCCHPTSSYATHALQDAHLNLCSSSALGDLLGEPLDDPLGRAAPVGELLGDPLGDPLGCSAPLGDLVGVWGDGHVTPLGVPLRGLWGAKRSGLVRALAAAGLLVAALAPEEPDIAPPVGVSQVESLAWRKPKPCRSAQPKYCCCLDRKSCEEG